MKYSKLISAAILVVISASQFFIYGFLDFMIVWFFYCLFYLAACIYQKFHASSLPSQIFTLIYVLLPLTALIIYAVKNGFPQLTRTFYIVFLTALALALLLEIIFLCLVIRERSNGKKRK